MTMTEAWTRSPCGVALHTSSTWHLCKETLQRLERWEFNMLRKLFNFKWKPGEGPTKS